MAAYAALVSLVNVVHNIQNHSRLSNSLDKTQIQSLCEKLDFLLDFVEDHHSDGGNEEAELLESQIASVARAAEDVIESHIVDRIEPLLAGSSTFEHERKSSKSLLDFLLSVMLLIENRPSLLTSHDRMQIESLGEKLDLLLDFIEKRDSHVGSREAEVLESQIASGALAIKEAFRYQLGDRFESRGAEIYPGDEEIKSRFLIDLLVFYMEQILNRPPLWISLESQETELICMVVDILQYLTHTSYNSDGQIAEYVTESKDAGSTSDHDERGSNSTMNAMKKKVMKVHKKIFSKKVVFAGSENSFLPDLQKVLEEMDSVKERVVNVRKGRGFKDVPPTYSAPVPSSKPLTTGRASVVGFESYFDQLLDWLTSHQSDLQIISITGMGGIGKTTLTRKVYDDLLVVQHFDVRAWLTISQDCNVRELLFRTLSGMVKSHEELVNKTEDELGVVLHKILYGRRYLIVLDDMWCNVPT